MAPEKIRASVGTAAALGLLPVRVTAPPTTAYLMLYASRRCAANCGFCPQARGSTSQLDHLSRVNWPPFRLERVAESLSKVASEGKVKRACVQTLNYPGMFDDLVGVVSRLKAAAPVVKVSCAVSPLTRKQFETLRGVGVERVGVALDACTPELFERVKGRGGDDTGGDGTGGADGDGSHRWQRHLAAMDDALEVFGRGFVSTHFIVGLGETEQELLEALEAVLRKGVLPSLFAFTPVKGTRMESEKPPPLLKYRKMQLGRFLLATKNGAVDQWEFSGDGTLKSFHVSPGDLRKIVELGTPFQTAGCPNCNRPYYTSSPGGPQYNFPAPLSAEEKEEVYGQLLPFCDQRDWRVAAGER
ncbi:MAG: radical SAM protein [Promethearchaeota archaeon]